MASASRPSCIQSITRHAAIVAARQTRTSTALARDAARPDMAIDQNAKTVIMDTETKAFLMVVRKILREILGALEDYLGMPRSIERRIR